MTRGLDIGGGYVVTYPREDDGVQFRARITQTADGWRWSFERQDARGAHYIELSSKVTAKRPAPSAARRWADRQLHW